ncbi:hypothetical protein H310_04411 [Aphanomyces invadans]|uniref:PPIase cyclophilin-type domain-containing protein n=1 Tax=Aphanomyces invadans TaxID=157072 RepID=A0A024UC74_9STRA|nr:hypothetical protein H310_04411 [Aphanomyces invadans]ETW04006.1 hypothetical protein H310_04411 [Aphanomyces invadans]|eukprot:XP_008866962.1 hypothetical protein H310_04411 [Aphanomyces invadans]
MSNIYVTEPNTEGKVLMRTTFGDLDVEFWPQQAPRACRNFFQLAMEKYYDNTLFHRLISGFMIQGGDPTGTGDGGESAFGEPFPDEFHSRLRFNHRGLLAMANSNKPNTNRSQFFFTLDACDFLTKKHTIFGKVTGNTIFNLLTVNDMETSGDERPIEPIKLLTIEILWNPFEDIVPRSIKAAPSAKASTAAAEKKKRRQGTKDLKLLSFGDEADDEFVQQPVKKAKGSLSSHDVLRDPKLSQRVDENLQTKVASVPAARVDRPKDDDDGGSDDAADVDAGSLSTLKARISDKLKKKSAYVHTTAKPKVLDDDAATADQLDDGDADEATKKKLKKASKKASKKDEYTLLREELKKTHKAAAMLKGDKLKAAEAEKAFQEMLTPLQLRRQKYLATKRSSTADRQKQTLARLESFKETLTKVLETKKTAQTPARADESQVYHGQVFEEGSDADDDDGHDAKDPSWMTKELKFKKHIDLALCWSGKSLAMVGLASKRARSDPSRQGANDARRDRDIHGNK